MTPGFWHMASPDNLAPLETAQSDVVMFHTSLLPQMDTHDVEWPLILSTNTCRFIQPKRYTLLATLILRNFPGFRYYQFPVFKFEHILPLLTGASFEISAPEITDSFPKPHHIAYQIKGHLITFSSMCNLMGFLLYLLYTRAATASTLFCIALLFQSYSHWYMENVRWGHMETAKFWIILIFHYPNGVSALFNPMQFYCNLINSFRDIHLYVWWRTLILT